MTTLSAKCPAKINLVLEVLDKRPDSYHNLWTVFQKIGIYDELIASNAESLQLDTNRPVTSKPEENLVYKAAIALQQYSNCQLGAHLYLNKILPDGAGLGGGSSDAAIALLLCRKLWNLPVTDEELLKIAAALGADVPLFVNASSTMLGTGKGENLETLPNPMSPWVVIATPRTSVPTALAYGLIRMERDSTAYSFEQTIRTNPNSPYLWKCISNHFEAPILLNFPRIREISHILSAIPHLGVGLCGSGASMFSFHNSLTEARQALNAVKPHCRFATITRFLNHNFVVVDS